jgi:hypothetical protein
MQKFDSSVRIWLVLLLTIALPLGSQAIEVHSSCHLACAKEAKTCHSCCGDRSGCFSASAKALPITPSTSTISNLQSDVLLLALPRAVPSLTTLSDSKSGIEFNYELVPPPRDWLSHDCILLL